MKNDTPSIAVIGGGAAGLMAAICASRAGSSVTIFEKNDRVGKKILVTGNGRCNLTNRDIRMENYHGDPEFAMKVIGRFGKEKTLVFFEELGLQFHTDEAGRIFPYSQQAGSVLDALRFEAEKLNVNIYTGLPAASVKRAGNRFEVATQAGKTFSFDRIILACGGKADPDLGSDGSGFRLAESLGHTITPVFPSLVQLRLNGQNFRAMERMKWVAELRAVADGKIRGVAKGDIIFTSYGISGTAVLSISRKIVENLNNDRPVELEADLLPDETDDRTAEILKKRIAGHPGRKMEDFFLGWLNKRIGQTLLKTAGIELSRESGSMSAADTEKIRNMLHHWRFSVAGHNGWQNAQTTAGGVKTSDVNAADLGSKSVKGLYFAGEILDVDGDSGGYNLQWAWSSGAVAGTAAAAGEGHNG